MKKIIYTRSDGGISIVIPAPKHIVDREFMYTLTQEEYENHVRERSIPSDAINVRELGEEDIPNTREFRNAWCDTTPEARIDIDLSKAKEIQLEKLREARQIEFEKLGFPQKIHQALEDAIVDPETKQKLQELRDATEPLKALKAQGYNDESVLQQIRDLGKLPE